MGAKGVRAAGAIGLVAGMVLMVSGAAWPTPSGPGLPGDPPVSRALEGVLAVPGSVFTEPAHESPGDSRADDGSARGDDDFRHEDAGAQYESAGRDPQAQGDSESRDAYITRTCVRILGQPPTGGLDKTTDPPDGSTVAEGDEINVALTWDPADWSGESLHKAIDCVTINDSFVLGLTVEERPTANDGTFETTYSIPVDVVAGDEICDQGFLSGDSSGGGFEQDRSNQVCFKVEAASTSAQAPSPAPVTPAPAPAPATPSRTPAQAPGEAAPAPVPTDVFGEHLVAPAAPAATTAFSPGPAGPSVLEVAGATLPRTGQETRRGPVLAGGVILMLGGLGLISGNRRPRRTLQGSA